jgi:hypothetical protein
MKRSWKRTGVGSAFHRIAQIFRERNVDISTQHLMRAIRLFIAEGTPAKVSEQRPGTPSPGGEKKITYSLSEQASPLVREEEFAKQLRLARYLAGASLGRPRDIEKAVEKAQTIIKPKTRAKAQSGSKKGVEAELARERRRVQQPGQRKASSGRGRSEKQRSGPGR